MDSTITKEEDGTIVLNITIPQNLIKKTTDEVIEETVKTADISGFRKGMAPKKIVEEKIDREKVKEEALKKLLPQAYADAVKKHDIKPVINPKIHIEKLPDGQDWKFTATTCEIPQIDLNGYKENVRKITAKSKIVIPGKEEANKTSMDEIINELLKSVSIKVSRVIVENETDRLLAQTLDEVKKLGLTLEQYLSSTGKSAQDLRKEYEEKALNDIKLEFALSKIAEDEKITVDDAEVEKAIGNAKDERERKSLEANRYVLAGIIRQQKTLDFLKQL